MKEMGKFARGLLRYSIHSWFVFFSLDHWVVAKVLPEVPNRDSLESPKEVDK